MKWAQICSLWLLLSLCMFCIYGCSKIWENKEWNGWSEEQIIVKLGKPSYITTLHIDNKSRLTELQSRLYSKLRIKEIPDGMVVEIKQLIWDNKLKTVAVWLKRIDKKWIVVDNMSWRFVKI